MPRSPRSIAFPDRPTLLVHITPEQVTDASTVQSTPAAVFGSVGLGLIRREYPGYPLPLAIETTLAPTARM
jgi:hypothetical protein